MSPDAFAFDGDDVRGDAEGGDDSAEDDVEKSVWIRSACNRFRDTGEDASRAAAVGLIVGLTTVAVAANLRISPTDSPLLMGTEVVGATATPADPLATTASVLAAWQLPPQQQRATPRVASTAAAVVVVSVAEDEALVGVSSVVTLTSRGGDAASDCDTDSCEGRGRWPPTGNAADGDGGASHVAAGDASASRKDVAMPLFI